MSKVTESLRKLTLIAKDNNLNAIKDINQPINLYISGEEAKGCPSTALGLAALAGNSFLVEELLKNGSNPNIPSCGYKQEFMPIHMTIWGAQGGTNISERIKIINLLDKYHADLHWRGSDIYSWSPLATSDLYSPTLGAQLLRLGVNPTATSSARQIEKVTNINKSSIFVKLACEEAKAKYESDDQGYKLPSELHKDILTQLQDLKFQYNPDMSLLAVTIERFNQNEEKYTWNQFCSETVKPNHTDIFDLSEVKVEYAGSITMADIFNSLESN